jgi:hypothetical protein
MSYFTNRSFNAVERKEKGKKEKATWPNLARFLSAPRNIHGLRTEHT